MIGIYKITSPSGKVYIGQSINIKKRFLNYKHLLCKGQTRLYSSFIKHGVDNHIFEIIIECKINELNELERYYQELYNCIGLNGLNCQYVKTKYKKYQHSEETKRKISLSNLGKKGRKYIMSDEHKQKISQSNKGKKRPDVSKRISELNKTKTGCNNNFFGKKHTQETKNKISKTKLLRKNGLT